MLAHVVYGSGKLDYGLDGDHQSQWPGDPGRVPIRCQELEGDQRQERQLRGGRPAAVTVTSQVAIRRSRGRCVRHVPSALVALRSFFDSTCRPVFERHERADATSLGGARHQARGSRILDSDAHRPAERNLAVMTSPCPGT